MKTHKKFVSILCAVALLVSALPAASAVSAEPLSEYAGETVSVHVTQIDIDGQTAEAYINVDVPKNATVLEAEDLLQAAAIATVDPVSRFRAAEEVDYLYTVGGVRFTTSYKSIQSVYMEHDYTRLVFMFNFGTFTGNPTNVTLRLTDANSHTFTLNGELNPEYNGQKSAEIIIYKDRTYNGAKVPMYNGAYLGVEGKVDSGEIVFSGITAKGYYNA